jgi:hypothetical protein
MGKINSKNKGAGFERQIVKALVEWTGIEFFRSPGSGAFSTRTKMEEMSGDIVCSNPDFKYSIECKKVESIVFEHLLCNKKCLLYKYWNQCITQCPENKMPLLVFSKNRSPIYCMGNMLPSGIIDNFKYQGIDPDCVSKFIKLYLFKFEDLLRTNPNNAFITRT